MMQLRFRRSRDDAEHVGDLVVLVALDVVQHEHLARARCSCCTTSRATSTTRSPTCSASSRERRNRSCIMRGWRYEDTWIDNCVAKWGSGAWEMKGEKR